MSYIKEKYANELDRPMTLDDLGGMRRPGFVPLPEEQEYIDSLDHDSFLESISMPAFYKIFDRIVGNDEVKRTLASVLTMTCSSLRTPFVLYFPIILPDISPTIYLAGFF